MIPLARAMLCLDCDVLYDANAGRRCPACHSPYVMPIATWLNRERDAQQDITVTPLGLLALAESLGIDCPEQYL